MAHHHAHGGYARAAQRRGDEYAMCLTCGQRAHRFQAKPIEPIVGGIREVSEILVGMVVLLTWAVAFWLVFAIAMASQVAP